MLKLWEHKWIPSFHVWSCLWIQKRNTHFRSATQLKKKKKDLKICFSVIHCEFELFTTMQEVCTLMHLYITHFHCPLGILHYVEMRGCICSLRFLWGGTTEVQSFPQPLFTLSLHIFQTPLDTIMHTAFRNSVVIGVKETELLHNFYFVVLYTFTDCLQFGRFVGSFFFISD